MMWVLYNGGREIGQKGSENGTIIEDEEYAGSCRITLEKSGAIASFNITCGIYGLMVHTTFSSNEEDARRMYEGMKTDIVLFLQSNQDESEWCDQFISKW